MTEKKKNMLMKRVEDILAGQRAIEVRTPDQYKNAGEFLRAVKHTVRIIDEAYEPDYRKTKEKHEAVRDERNGLKKPLAEAEKIVKLQMKQFSDEEEKRIREEREAMEKARQEAAEQGEETFMAPVIETQPTAVAGVSYAYTWTWEIEDESKIPREYMIPDATKIRQQVLSHKQDTNIPGIRVFQEKQVRAR